MKTEYDLKEKLMRRIFVLNWEVVIVFKNREIKQWRPREQRLEKSRYAMRICVYCDAD